MGSSRRHLGPGGLQLLGDATGPACERRGARSPAPALFPPPRHLPRLPLRKRQLRGAGAASRHLPRPPRRRPAPQPGRGAPRLPVSTAGGSARLPPGMNIMDFNVKKLAADAGTFLSRAVQVRRRRLRPGWWRLGRARGGLARGRRRPGYPGLPMGAAWRPCPAGRFRLARPHHRRPAPGEASRDAAQGVLGPGHLGFTPGRRPRCPGRRGRARRAPWRHPHPSLRSPSPSRPCPTEKGVSFSCPSNAEELPARFPPALSVPGRIVPRA